MNESLTEMSNSPLGQTAVGWVLGVILIFGMAIIWMYFHKIVIPSQRQELAIRQTKTNSDMETQQKIADATTAISMVVSSIDKRLTEQGTKLDTQDEKLNQLLKNSTA
tara:strand:- start:76 stop:399 length:324 start_codon:yes stop_codon:yes gene_type:complete